MLSLCCLMMADMQPHEWASDIFSPACMSFIVVCQAICYPLYAPASAQWDDGQQALLFRNA